MYRRKWVFTYKYLNAGFFVLSQLFANYTFIKLKARTFHYRWDSLQHNPHTTVRTVT